MRKGTPPRLEHANRRIEEGHVIQTALLRHSRLGWTRTVQAFSRAKPILLALVDEAISDIDRNSHSANKVGGGAIPGWMTRMRFVRSVASM